MQRIIVITWPWSQECMDCKHSLFVNNTDAYGSCAYACTLGVNFNGCYDSCPEKEVCTEEERQKKFDYDEYKEES